MASRAANQAASTNGQVGLAADLNRDMRAVLDQVTVVRITDTLPTDALSVRRGLDPATVAASRGVAGFITEEQAKAIPPPHHTGRIPAEHASQRVNGDAGISAGRLEPAS